MKRYLHYIWLSLPVLLTIVAGYEAYAAGKVLHIEVLNKTGNTLREVCVVSGRSACRVGVLGVDAAAVTHDFRMPMQTNAFVQFYSLGKNQKFEVSLVAPYSSEKRNGTLSFVIQTTNAVVSFVPDKD